jgi:uncharacterized protein (TIGR03000 family)
MRYHSKTMARRWLKKVLTGFMLLSGLAVVGLPNSYAQMRYSGGFRPTHQRPPQVSLTQPSDSTTAPQMPSSFFPDNDAAYPSYYLGSAPKRPLSSPSGAWPYSVLATDMPWNRADFEDYNEPLLIPRDSAVQKPQKYILSVTRLPPASAADSVEYAGLIAHVPEHAALWVQGTQTRSMGRTRYFLSPPLLPGRMYNYRVTVAWIEDGHWVSQTRMIPVEAGLIQAIYLRPAPNSPVKAASYSPPVGLRPIE